MRLRLAALAFLLLPQAAAQAQPKLELPVACTLGQDCYVQNYVDHDGGPGWKDFTCGPLSYDGHDGTDIALTDPTAWKRGVPVRASAAGRIKGVRDGMADMSTAAPGAPDVKNRECGNGVVIDHGDGWETQYCHLKRGSVRVRNGQQVAAGDALGDIGISGKAEFPHVHLSVRHNGEKLDPYTSGAATAACGAPPAGTLWARPVDYVSTGLAGSGFANAPAQRHSAMAGDYAANSFASVDGTLTFWATAFGVRQGDVIEYRLLGPTGSVAAEKRDTSPRDRGVAFDFVGIRARDGTLDPGVYRGEFRLMRGDRILAQSSNLATVQSAPLPNAPPPAVATTTVPPVLVVPPRIATAEPPAVAASPPMVTQPPVAEPSPVTPRATGATTERPERLSIPPRADPLASSSTSFIIWLAIAGLIIVAFVVGAFIIVRRS